MKASQEIVLLEKSIGGDPEKALRNRRVRRAILILRQAWEEEPMRFKSDLDELLVNTVRWDWPLKIYTPEERQEIEEWLRDICKAQREARLGEIRLNWWKKLHLKYLGYGG